MQGQQEYINILAFLTHVFTPSVSSCYADIYINAMYVHYVMYVHCVMHAVHHQCPVYNAHLMYVVHHENSIHCSVHFIKYSVKGTSPDVHLSVTAIKN